MGNCWTKAVEILPSANTRSPIPVPKADAKQRHKPSTAAERGSEGEKAPASKPVNIPYLKMFTLAELRSATRNFRPDSMIGEGGFGRVFIGYIDEKTLAPAKVGIGIPVAVKKSSGDSEQGLKEWQAEVKFLGKFRHPNLVKLLGYCWEDEQFLLVYEYMQKGSLESHLFTNGVGDVMPWDLRIKIAIGAARGLSFLHSTERRVIYRDFKASNILLDGDFNAKLSDFGLAKLGPDGGNSHVTTKVVGTFGYVAPEYMATGHLYVKSDVYGFGVVLLEVLTGLRAVDLDRPSGLANLIDLARPSLHDKNKLKKLVDPRLMGQYRSMAARGIADLILQCIQTDQKLRPSMNEVLEAVEKIGTIQMKNKEAKPNPSQSMIRAATNTIQLRSPRPTIQRGGWDRSNMPGHRQHGIFDKAHSAKLSK